MEQIPRELLTNLQKKSLTEAESNKLSMIIGTTSNALYAAKDIKDKTKLRPFLS